MTTDLPRLAIHVFGAGKGESIVLRLPDGRWGVVDCFAGSSADPATNPVLRFLESQKVTELEFLCLTHPHDDHFKGMSHLLEACSVRYFWLFNGLSGKHFLQLVQLLDVEVAAIHQEDQIENAREFAKIFSLVNQKKRCQQPPLMEKRPGPGTPLYPVPLDRSAHFQIIGLAPSGNQVSRYDRGLQSCFDSQGNVRGRLPQSHHNIVSVALLVVYGDTRIILGGDLEKAGWRDVIAEVGAANLAANVVKISHHGSPNGYCDQLWELFSANGKPVGVVTAYVPKLPSRTALDHIAQHTNKLLTTCLTALEEHQLPTGVDPDVFRSRLALMRKMGPLSDHRRHQCGQCTLIFDDQGHCIETELVPPAGELLPVS